MSTLLQLRTLAKQEGDFVNSNFISDAEWNSYINQSAFELYDLMVQKYGDDYFSKIYTFTTDGTTYLYPLPADFYKHLALDLALTNNSQDSWITISRFNFSARNRNSVPNFQSFYGVTNMKYRLNGGNIWLTPTPSAGQIMRQWYVPRLVPMVADGDTFDGISGWDEYIVVDAAIKAKDKEESDVSVLMARKQGLIARLEAAVENRDAAIPPTVSDNSSNQFWSNGVFGNGDGSGTF